MAKSTRTSRRSTTTPQRSRSSKASASRRSARSDPRVAKADERVVKRAKDPLPVSPAKRGRVPDHPTEPAAVDRRKQFTGTDEPATARQPRSR